MSERERERGEGRERECGRGRGSVRAITVDTRNEAMKLLTESDLGRQRDGTRESHTHTRARLPSRPPDGEDATAIDLPRRRRTSGHF